MANPLWYLLARPAANLATSFVDNVFRDAVLPVPGSIVYCDLVFGYAEHSGVYVGDGDIVQLSATGCIEVVSAGEFISGKTAVSIYASCQGGEPVGRKAVAKRALSLAGTRRDYNVLLDNCHQFSAGCLTGNFENSCNFLWMLKSEARTVLAADSWRICNAMA